MMRCVYSNVARENDGDIINDATITVYLAGSSTLASIYTTFAGTTATNSVTTNSSGEFTFYVDRFDYDTDQRFKYTVAKTGHTTKTYDNVDIDRVVITTYAGDKTLATHITVPKGVIYSGTITVTTGTVTTGTVTAGLYQIFSGTVTGLKEARPEWWGTDADAINAAINAVDGGVVQLSKGTYTATSTINLNKNGTWLRGDSRYGTIIDFAPTANDTMLSVGLASGGGLATPMWQPKISDLSLTSSDTTYIKTAIDWIDVHQGMIDNVSIKGFKGDATHASIGIHTFGRDENVFSNYYIDADKPFIIDQDPILPAHLFGLEYTNFHNGSTVAYADNAHFEFVNGVSGPNSQWTGYHVFSGGKWCLYAPSVFSTLPINYDLNNWTWDRPGADDGWMVYLIADLTGGGLQPKVSMRNFVAYVGTVTHYNGYYVTGYEPSTSSFEGLSPLVSSTGDRFGGDLTYTYKLIPITPSSVLTDGTEVTWTSVDLSTFVPNNAREVWGYASSSVGAINALLAPVVDGTGYFHIVGPTASTHYFRLPLKTVQTIWYRVGAGDVDIIISGYSF
jgi:hypothetical protein